MVYDHIVKFAGRYWPAGSDVPDEVQTEKAPEEQIKEQPEEKKPATRKRTTTKRQ